VAVDADHVYWVDSNAARVAQMDKDGTNAIDLALGGANNSYPLGLTVDGTNVYWGGIEDTLHRCKIGGCANAPATIATTGAGFTDLLVDTAKVYWLEGDGINGPWRIMSVSKTATGGSGVPLATLTTGGPFNRMAADADYIYVTSDDGAVRRYAKTDGKLTLVGQAPAGDRSFAVAVNESNAYFTAGDDPATIDSAPKIGGGKASPLVAAQHNPLALALDPVRLFWANSFLGLGGNDGAILTCAFSACGTPTVIADKQRSPVAIAIDANAIYWANFDSGGTEGGIMKLAKP
jgi:hypothetical protein